MSQYSDENDQQIIHDQQTIQKQLVTNKLNFKLIKEKCFDWKIHKNKSEEEKIKFMINSSSLQLQWLNIQKIENLEIFDNLQLLHLQNNQIIEIENLESLINLEYLALNNNLIKVLTGLKNNKKLCFLNVRKYNQVPKSIEIIDIRENKVEEEKETKIIIIKHLTLLETYNDEDIQIDEKEQILQEQNRNQSLSNSNLLKQVNKIPKEEQISEERDIKNLMEFDLIYNQDEVLMHSESIKQLNQKTDKILKYIKLTREKTLDQYEQRIEEYGQFQRSIINQVKEQSYNNKIKQLEELNRK